MFKKLTVLLLVVLGTFIFAAPAMPKGSTYSYVKIIHLHIGERVATINDVPSKLDYPVYNKAGRTLVPFRFLGEALGATVTWDDTNKIACLKLNGSEVKVTIGSTKATINNVESVLDVPAEVKEGSTFIPLRFVSEALGASVDYDAATRTVIVTAVNTAGWVTFTDSNGETFIYPQDWTVSGNTDTVITITSPLGTIITGQEVQTAVSEVIGREKAMHSNDGFELVKEGLIDENDPDSGYEALFLNVDTSDMGNSELIGVLAFEDADKHYVFKFKAKASNFIDFSVMSKIFE